MSLAQLKMKTPLGPLYLVASEKGLTCVFWDPRPVEMKRTQILEKAAQQLGEYFAGQRQTFDLPLDLEGTEFQKLVWKQLLKIPYGQTCSYKDIAVKLNDRNASRAVGTANGRNPISIIIPCHRVISSDGSLGGYSGGLDIKRQLLQLENQQTQFAGLFEGGGR